MIFIPLFNFNQSLKRNPQDDRKLGKPKTTWKRELKNELIKKINKTLSEVSTDAASKEKWKKLCAWSILEVESSR